MQCLMGTNLIYRFGTPDQEERLFNPAIRGEKIGTMAMTETEMVPQRLFRDGRFLLYGGGTSEVLRNIIAKEAGL